MIDLGKAPNGDEWELDLRNNGSGWTGTFASLIRTTAQAIIENGYENGRNWFVEVTLTDGIVLFGKIGEWRTDGVGDDSFTVAEVNSLPQIIETDEVVRFRA